MRRLWLLGLLAAGGLGVGLWLYASRPRGDGGPPVAGGEPVVIDVHPGGVIQDALEEAARKGRPATVRVHAGAYRPAVPGQALIHFNARHDGLTVEAVGDVTLTAANPDLARPEAPGYPAVVNRVIYFGDGVSRATVLRGFKITGANGFVRGPDDLKPIRTSADLEQSVGYVSTAPSPIEANGGLARTHYFYTDGAGILVYGRSSPTIENVEVIGNYTCVCGGGLSIQQSPAGWAHEPVLCRNCVFRDNRAAVSGGAVDLLTPGSRAIFENCLFVGNVSNERIVLPDHAGYGALTVFPKCSVTVDGCTFIRNSAGVDDAGVGSAYRNSIFWNNNRAAGLLSQPRFELDLFDARHVDRCFVHGDRNDVGGNISRKSNTFDPPDPQFDDRYRPRNPLYQGAGYRPVPAHGSGE
jgi:hypothetical protein